MLSISTTVVPNVSSSSSQSYQFVRLPVKEIVLRGSQILYELYAKTPIDGVLEYQYTILGAGLAQCDRAMRCSAGFTIKKIMLYKEIISSSSLIGSSPSSAGPLFSRANHKASKVAKTQFFVLERASLKTSPDGSGFPRGTDRIDRHVHCF